MTTTAHEDQYTVAPEPVRQPYDTVAILRRNVAALEVALRTQTERAESYAETLRSLASYVGAGGYNADTVDAGVFEEKIRGGIGEIMGRAEAAEAELEAVREDNHTMMLEVNGLREELAKLRKQTPVRWHVRGNYFHDGDAAILFAGMNSMCGAKVDQLFAAPVPVPHKGATHCDDCGLTWLDDGLNPLGCPYCKDTVPAPAAPNLVFMAHNKTSSILFAARKDADQYAASFGPAAGVSVTECAVIGSQSAPQAPAVPTNTIPEGDDFNGTTPHMIRCIESLVAMNDRGALAPHGLCGHSRTLLLASANRLRQQQAHVVPAVPEDWRDKLLSEFPLFDDEGLCQEKHHCEWSLQQDRKRLRALLQSAEVTK